MILHDLSLSGLSEATKQSINREFCRAKLGKHADACDSLPHTTPPVIAALDAAISFYIDCRVKPDNDKGGNDRASSIARSEATWQSIIYIPKCIFTTLVHKNKKKRGNYINLPRLY